MSISGSLEDVSVADVMQFIHLGRRTGTLVLHRSDESGRIGFHEGRLVNAHGPKTKKLGDLLVSSGVMTRKVLEAAVKQQSESTERISLGQLLLAQGSLNEKILKDVVSTQIERTVSDLVTWEAGTFEFAVGDLAPVDEIALFPEDVVPGTDMNTQMVLLEAARIFDERNRNPDAHDRSLDQTLVQNTPTQGPEELDETHPVLPLPDPPSFEIPPSDDADRQIAALGEERPELRFLAGCSLHLVSPDKGLFRSLVEALPVTTVERRRLSDAGQTDPARASAPTSTIVLVDLRKGVATLKHVAEVHAQYPAAPIIALVDQVVPVSQVYAAGALAAVPAEVDAVVACVHNILQSRQQMASFAGGPPVIAKPLGANGGAGVARLRRVFGDLRSGLLSATVALNLMHIISESVERAVLFLVRQNCLQALGAFGMGANGSPLAELTRGMRLDPSRPTILADSLNSGETVTARFDDAILPDRLKEVLGRPINGQVVVFPVLGAQRVISVIYTDNGQVDRLIEDIEILELATAQVGMAFENELLRRQIARQEPAIHQPD